MTYALHLTPLCLYHSSSENSITCKSFHFLSALLLLLDPPPSPICQKNSKKSTTNQDIVSMIKLMNSRRNQKGTCLLKLEYRVV